MDEAPVDKVAGKRFGIRSLIIACRKMYKSKDTSENGKKFAMLLEAKLLHLLPGNADEADMERLLNG